MLRLNKLSRYIFTVDYVNETIFTVLADVLTSKIQKRRIIKTTVPKRGEMKAQWEDFRLCQCSKKEKPLIHHKGCQKYL